MCVSPLLFLLINICTMVDNSLVVDRIYRGYVMAFSNSETQADLILINLIDFDVNLSMDWLSSPRTILYWYAKILTLAYTILSRLVWKGDVPME